MTILDDVFQVHPPSQLLLHAAAAKAEEIKSRYGFADGGMLAYCADAGIISYAAVFYEMRAAVAAYVSLGAAYKELSPEKYPEIESFPPEQQQVAASAFFQLFSAQLMRAQVTDYLSTKILESIQLDLNDPILHRVLTSDDGYMQKCRADFVAWGHLARTEQGIEVPDIVVFRQAVADQILGSIIGRSRQIFIEHEINGKEVYPEDMPQAPDKPVQPLGINVFPSRLSVTEGILARREQAQGWQSER
ncbi:MAG: hypothetical protein J0L97_08215 [Alphaproteobacteria bacterium]|nr:hypothetical protein [Alphaproteobacteria bacterium]